MENLILFQPNNFGLEAAMRKAIRFPPPAPEPIQTPLMAPIDGSVSLPKPMDGTDNKPVNGLTQALVLGSLLIGGYLLYAWWKNKKNRKRKIAIANQAVLIKSSSGSAPLL